MNNQTLRDALAETWYAAFYATPLGVASEFRQGIAREVSDKLMRTLLDYVPSEAMFTEWRSWAFDADDIIPRLDRDICTYEWRRLIQAAMEEKGKMSTLRWEVITAIPELQNALTERQQERDAWGQRLADAENCIETMQKELGAALADRDRLRAVIERSAACIEQQADFVVALRILREALAEVES